MSAVSIYDINSQQWYEQETTGDSGGIPTTLAQGCTVVAAAEDGPSYNIYWYGGHNGFAASQTLSATMSGFFFSRFSSESKSNPGMRTLAELDTCVPSRTQIR